jgi:homoaconitase
LSNISENTLMTAVNDENGHINIADDGHGDDTIPKTMQKYKQRNEPWMLVVDDNCELGALPLFAHGLQLTCLDGEGSAREHAALQPRYYGCSLILARSFARIHETNLKKQGILPLWFVNKADYSRISAFDKITTRGVEGLLDGTLEGDEVTLVVKRPDGETYEVKARHTMSRDQVEWLRAGSALNWIGEQARRSA